MSCHSYGQRAARAHTTPAPRLLFRHRLDHGGTEIGPRVGCAEEQKQRHACQTRQTAHAARHRDGRHQPLESELTDDDKVGGEPTRTLLSCGVLLYCSGRFNDAQQPGG